MPGLGDASVTPEMAGLSLHEPPGRGPGRPSPVSPSPADAPSASSSAHPRTKLVSLDLAQPKAQDVVTDATAQTVIAAQRCAFFSLFFFESRSSFRTRAPDFSDHYYNYMLYRERRKERLAAFHAFVEMNGFDEVVRAALWKKFCARESGLLRLARQPVTLQNFELQRLIGRGAFGKVTSLSFLLAGSSAS